MSSYLVFKNYGSASCEELDTEAEHLFHAIERAEMLADISYNNELISVVSYDSNANAVFHHEVWGCNVPPIVLEDTYINDDWEYAL